MLIQTPYKIGDVVSLKLTSGEEMVARLEAESTDELTVTRPLMLTATQQGVGLAPFMFTIDPDAKVKLKLNNIVCTVKTVKDAADMYIQQTSGIQTV